jgi:hypothetical protein
VIPMRTKDEDPVVKKENRIALLESVIDRKKAEIEHMQLTKRGLTEKIAEDKLYLAELRGDLKELKKKEED